MLWKLQKKTLIPSQIIGYFFTLAIGAFIVLTVIQLFFDLKPLIHEESDVFNNNSAVISKNVSLFKTINKDKIYFTPSELDELKAQPFIESVSKFTSANFKIKAYTNQSATMPAFSTDLFFESIPDKYLDVKSEDWKWNPESDFLPIVIPETYLNLYNFGFAESQGLPVFSKNTVSQIGFNIRITGNSKYQEFRSKIIGFSTKINSILVPEDFLLWANNEFSSINEKKTSRLLIEFTDPTDERILNYFSQHDYAINKEKLEFSKLTFFFKSALLFVACIALIIVILSVAFILLSMNFITQKNKEQIQNLYDIGYSDKRISMIYQLIISGITLAGIICAIVISSYIRNYYITSFSRFFDFSFATSSIIWSGILLFTILFVLYNIFLRKTIRNIVIPQKTTNI
jgi:ABC-type antimicrobial peptide transport system permease subunit